MKPSVRYTPTDIPSSVVISSKRHIHVGTTDAPGDDRSLCGEWWPRERIIWINRNIAPDLQVITYLHELLHAISDDYDIGLSERQILKLEKAFPYLLEKGNVFKP